jgi:starch-binding outer membrane protein, SusD/RagB family
MKMRQLKWIALAGILAACDSPLDTEPTASIDAGTALNSARGVELALNGAYRALQSSSLYTRQELAFPDLYADNLNFTGTFAGDREVSLRNIQPSNGEVGGIWSSAYIGVNRANYILDAIPNVSDLTDAKKAQYRGEALWIRGLMYSLLVKYYGGVPLVDTPSKGVDDSMFKPRSTLAETYAFIVKDLEEASSLLPAARANGRATKGAADAILARTYLEMGDNAKARDKATALIGNPTYRLVPSVREFFTNKNGVESIYEVQHTVANANSAAFWFFPPSLGGRWGFAPSPGLINAFEANDARRAATVARAGSQDYGFKYYRIATGDDNIPVARLAEQYLIRAEANARLGAPAATVQADINVIRNRSGLGNIATTVTTQAALLDAILQERRVELAFEGFRFMDLRRHGKAESVLGIASNRLLWPVPLYETDVNKNLTQNPGY